MKDQRKTKAQLIEELEALRQSEERYRQLFESANDAIISLTLDGIITTTNRGAEVLLGWSREERVGRHYSEFLTPASVTFTAERARRIQAGEKVSSIYELEVVRKDGSVVPVEAWSRFIRDREGKLIGILTIHRDITERKRAEEALHESEQRYRSLFENANDAIISISLDGTITAVNRGLEVMTGWSRKELVGQHYNQLTTPHAAALERERTRRALAGERLSSIYEAEVMRKDGCIVPVEGKARFIRDREGKPIGSQAIMRDISVRKRAEEALRESEERYRSVITALEEGIVLQHADGTIQACNASAERILGVSAETLRGMTSVDRQQYTIREDGALFSGQEHPAMVTLRTGKPRSNVEMGVYKPNGELGWISINSQPLFRDGETTPYAVVTSFTDITDRKQMAQEREALYGLAHDLACASDVHTVADHLFARCKSLLGADYGFLMLGNPAGTELKGIAAYGAGTDMFFGERTEVGAELAQAALAFARKEVVEVADMARSPLLSPRLRERYGLVRSAWLVPLISGEQAVGVLCVGYATQQELAPPKLRLLQLFGDEAALALERARLTEELREKEEQLRTVISNAPIVLWALDREGVLTFSPYAVKGIG